MIVMGRLPARAEKPAEGIGQPKGTKDVNSGFSAVSVGFRVKQRCARRQAIIAPNLHDVGDQCRLLIQVLPGSFASVIRIMLERHEGKILNPSVRLQVIKESPKP